MVGLGTDPRSQFRLHQHAKDMPLNTESNRGLQISDNFDTTGYSLTDYAQRWTTPHGLWEMEVNDTQPSADGHLHLAAVPFLTASDFAVNDHLKYLAVSSQTFVLPENGTRLLTPTPPLPKGRSGGSRHRGGASTWPYMRTFSWPWTADGPRRDPRPPRKPRNIGSRSPQTWTEDYGFPGCHPGQRSPGWWQKTTNLSCNHTTGGHPIRSGLAWARRDTNEQRADPRPRHRLSAHPAEHFRKPGVCG